LDGKSKEVVGSSYLQIKEALLSVYGCDYFGAPAAEQPEMGDTLHDKNGIEEQQESAEECEEHEQTAKDEDKMMDEPETEEIKQQQSNSDVASAPPSSAATADAVDESLFR
jgi:hypothetical protein